MINKGVGDLFLLLLVLMYILSLGSVVCFVASYVRHNIENIQIKGDFWNQCDNLDRFNTAALFEMAYIYYLRLTVNLLCICDKDNGRQEIQINFFLVLNNQPRLSVLHISVTGGSRYWAGWAGVRRNEKASDKIIFLNI